MAIAVCVRRLVRAGRRQKIVARPVLTHHAVDFGCLPIRSVLRDSDLVLPAVRLSDAALARALDLSHQQGRSGRAQVRALPGAGGHCGALRARRMARPAVALAVADDPVRSELAGDFLPRGGPWVHRLFPSDGDFRRPRPARTGWNLRDRDDVRPRMAVVVVQAQTRQEQFANQGRPWQRRRGPRRGLIRAPSRQCIACRYSADSRGEPDNMRPVSRRRWKKKRTRFDSCANQYSRCDAAVTAYFALRLWDGALQDMKPGRFLSVTLPSVS